MYSIFLIFFNGALYPSVVFYLKRVFLLIMGIDEKNLHRVSLIFNKLQAWGLQLYEKRDSGTGIFLVILWNVQENLWAAAAIYERSYKLLMSWRVT